MLLFMTGCQSVPHAGETDKACSRQLRSALDTTLEQLTELESQAAQKQETMEAEVNNLALTW